MLGDAEVERVVGTDALQPDAGELESADEKLGLTRLTNALWRGLLTSESVSLIRAWKLEWNVCNAHLE